MKIKIETKPLTRYLFLSLALMVLVIHNSTPGCACITMSKEEKAMFSSVTW